MKVLKFFIAILFLLSFSIPNVNAELIGMDLQDAGDGLITRDTESGLDWLDVSLTANQTYDEVQTGIWYQRGFRHATKTRN